MTGVDIPLLRKVVEWAETEAAKPPELCEWNQETWVAPANKADDEAWSFGYVLPKARVRAPECGTCFCIAGYTASITVGPTEDIGEVAQEILGLCPGDAGALFNVSNTIEDIRRIAEDIAGESL